MKKYGSLIALALALVFGLLSVVLTRQWLARQVPQEQVHTQVAVPLTRIVVAARDVEIGTPLSKENLTLAEWPKGNVPLGSFEAPEPLEGRVAVTRLVAGSPILAAELAVPGSGSGLVALIAPGRRAMSIRVDEVIGVGGFIIPNTFVDVIGVESGRRGEPTADTILKRVKVLAIAQETANDEGKPKVVRTVTLELEPRAAEKLALQTQKGSIHLVLRNPLEAEKAPEKKVAVRPRPVRSVAPAAVSPPVFRVELIQGDRQPERYEFKAVSGSRS